MTTANDQYVSTVPRSRAAPARAKKMAKTTSELASIPSMNRSPASEKFSMTNPAPTAVRSSSTCTAWETSTSR